MCKRFVEEGEREGRRWGKFQTRMQDAGLTPGEAGKERRQIEHEEPCTAAQLQGGFGQDPSRESSKSIATARSARLTRGPCLSTPGCSGTGWGDPQKCGLRGSPFMEMEEQQLGLHRVLLKQELCPSPHLGPTGCFPCR